jgi:hypothetical protein
MAQAQQSSAFSRQIINLFAGMAYGSPDLPRVLVDAGYTCHSIEASFAVSGNKLVNPELILCSDTDNHTLIVEAKSGANLKTDQLKRYALITSESLVKQAFTNANSAKHHDVLVVGQENLAGRLLLGSATVPSPRRIICVVLKPFASFVNPSEVEATDELVQQSIPFQQMAAKPSERGLKRIENVFATQRLNDAFNPLLEIDWDVVPNNFLPVDHESENWEFAQYIFPEIIAAILNGNPTIRVDDVARSFIRHWDFIAAAYKKILLDKIRLILKIAAQKRFAPYITFGARGSSKRDIALKIPETLSENIGAVRFQLNRRLRDLLGDFNSPQIAIIYED